MLANSRYLFFFFLLAMISCDKGVDPPFLDYPTVGENNYRDLSLNLVSYDMVRITHRSGTDLRSPEVQAVGVGVKDSTGYSEFAFTKATYNEQLHIFYYSFDLTITLDSSKLSSLVSIRYYLTNGAFLEVDTTVILYNYPYQSTQLILTTSEVPYAVYFQDIARTVNKLYIHPTGPEGLWEYDLTTKASRQLVRYPGGDHIAADSIFVFCDISHNSVYRYDVTKDTGKSLIQGFPLSSLAGLEAYMGFLYVMVSSPIQHLKKYTYDGVLVDSIVFPGTGYYLTIHNDILYNVSFGRPDQIQRFDLNSRSLLANLHAPSYWIDGIKSYGNTLYFCSSRKRFLGSVPISELTTQAPP